MFLYHTNQRQVCLFLTHWRWVAHIWVSTLTIIGFDNGLWPGRCQAIIWTNAGILLIGPLAWKYRLENGGHLVMASMCDTWLHTYFTLPNPTRPYPNQPNETDSFPWWICNVLETGSCTLFKSENVCKFSVYTCGIMFNMCVMFYFLNVYDHESCACIGWLHYVGQWYSLQNYLCLFWCILSI